jgi:hypothetical protein
VRVISIFGNSVGAIGLNHFLDRMEKALRSGDRLLMDGELFAGNETLAGYDHPVNRAFALSPLKAVGITPSDGALRFTLQPPQGGSPIGRIRKDFYFKRAATIRLGDQGLSFRRGEVLGMSPSDKYDRDDLLRFLASRKYLTLEEEFLSPDRQFALG